MVWSLAVHTGLIIIAPQDEIWLHIIPSWLPISLEETPDRCQDDSDGKLL